MILGSAPRQRSAWLVACAGFSLAACGQAGRESQTQPGETRTGGAPILATTSIWADITSRVACGEAVTSLIPPGSDPHTFEPSLQDRAAIDDAGLIVANGSALEESLVDVLDTVAADGVNVVEMTPHIDVLPGQRDAHGDESAASGDDGHGHDAAETGDPHVWQDPARIAGALDVIASAVIATGRDQSEIEACTNQFRVELEQLDRDIVAILAPIPDQRRVLVTNHDSLAYFADRYDLTVIGTVIPSISTVAETDAAALAELSDVIAEHDVPAIFSGELESAVDAEALAGRLGVAIVPIPTDSLTTGGDASSYIELMRSNATTIATALSAP
jgi:zinc/manganese transport system substrate-binding protein